MCVCCGCKDGWRKELWIYWTKESYVHQVETCLTDCSKLKEEVKAEREEICH